MMDTLNEIKAMESTDSLGALVRRVWDWVGVDACFASSLGAEDQVMTHAIQTHCPDLPIFVLDTGRLNQETYNVMQQTMRQYNMTYHVYYPKTKSVETMVQTHGPNHFYDSVANRKACCQVRKVEPLNRALMGKKVWMTGMRRAQSVTRAALDIVEQDADHGLVKINPLVAWSRDDVWQYIHSNAVPYNALHDQGFQSIGCAPCTRAVSPGDDDRSGRWWWESPEQKECGLHVSPLPKKDQPR